MSHTHGTFTFMACMNRSPQLRQFFPEEIITKDIVMKTLERGYLVKDFKKFSTQFFPPLTQPFVN